MFPFSMSRVIRAFTALLAITLLMTGTAIASDLIINMGKDSDLQWSWNPEKPLNGSYYGLVMSKQEAQEIVKKLPIHLQESAFANVDFAKQAAIVAYLGEAPRGGYEVSIHSIQVSNKSIWVNVNRRSPGPDEVTTLMMTYPIVVKAVAKSDLPQKNFAVWFTDQKGHAIAQQHIKVQVPQKPQTKTVKFGIDSMLQWKWNVNAAPKGAFYSVVTSQQEALLVAARMPKALRKNAFDGVDFKKQIALVAYLGKAPNSGFAIDMYSAEINPKAVKVTISRRSPEPKEFTLPTLTYPMVVKTLDRNALPTWPFTVQFVDQKGQDLAQEILASKTTLQTVKPGQTLWYIAWQNGVSVQDIVRWNHLATNVNIMPGQTLRINH